MSKDDQQRRMTRSDLRHVLHEYGFGLVLFIGSLYAMRAAASQSDAGGWLKSGTVVSLVLMVLASSMAKDPHFEKRLRVRRWMTAIGLVAFGASIAGVFVQLVVGAGYLGPLIYDFLRRSPTAAGVTCIILLGSLAFLIRRYLRAIYGLVEMAVSVQLGMVFMQDRYDDASGAIGGLQWNDAMKGILCTSVYLFVRGADNVDVGLFDEKQHRRDRLWSWFRPRLLVLRSGWNRPGT